jgi:hypothetical protein
MTFATVRALGRTLPDVEESTMYGAPALKWHGTLLACIASNKAAEPNTLVVRMGFDERDALIADDPITYYLKDHYVNYDVVLVRLSKVSKAAMHDLLQGAWRRVASGGSARKRLRKTDGYLVSRRNGRPE